MKVVLAIAVLLSTSQALALDSLCVTKQKNAASFKLAQELGVPVQGVEVLGFEHGPWTEAVGNNTGSDRVTVRANNREDRAMTFKTYEVFAKQINTTADCNILDVIETQ